MNSNYARPSKTDLIRLENYHSSGVYAKKEILFDHGKGALLWDTEGKQYIDCIAGHGIANLGHNHPKVVEAI